MEAGAVSITFQDTHDTPVFEPLPGETRLWGDTDVIGLFDAETDMKEVVAILENHPLLGAGFAHKIEQLEDKDWEREWMDNFHPMRVGERLWICPSWRDVPDENAVNVMLDPGLAFGTGTCLLYTSINIAKQKYISHSIGCNCNYRNLKNNISNVIGSKKTVINKTEQND